MRRSAFRQHFFPLPTGSSNGRHLEAIIVGSEKGDTRVQPDCEVRRRREVVGWERSGRII